MEVVPKGSQGKTSRYCVGRNWHGKKKEMDPCWWRCVVVEGNACPVRVFGMLGRRRGGRVCVSGR